MIVNDSKLVILKIPEGYFLFHQTQSADILHAAGSPPHPPPFQWSVPEDEMTPKNNVLYYRPTGYPDFHPVLNTIRNPNTLPVCLQAHTGIHYIPYSLLHGNKKWTFPWNENQSFL